MFPMFLEAVSVTTAFSDITAIGSSLLDFIQGNALLMCCFAGCLVKIATRLLKGARKAVGA